MASDKCRVLVVDDDPGMIEFVNDALPKGEFDVVSAKGGEQALRLTGQRSFDLIIVDILMPGKDGLETLMDLRRQQNGAKVIAMSGGGSFRLANALTWAEKMGAQRTLRKPFTPAELLSAVRETLGLAAN